jgi:hypothetical protein
VYKIAQTEIVRGCLNSSWTEARRIATPKFMHAGSTASPLLRSRVNSICLPKRFEKLLGGWNAKQDGLGASLSLVRRTTKTSEGTVTLEYSERTGWRPLESVPLNEDVFVLVSDGQGEPYSLSYTCKLTEAGWTSSDRGTFLTVTPLKWRICFNPQSRSARAPLIRVQRPARSNSRGSSTPQMS